MRLPFGYVCLRQINFPFIIFLVVITSRFSLGNNDDAMHQLETIIITSEKRPEPMLRVPESITVLTNTAIQQSGINSIKEASYLIPNLFISEFSARRTSFPFIRGIGSGRGAPTVTTIIDGVPQLTSNTTNIDFLDLERIEFIRGPQGTLHGLNTLGGVINIITQKPSDESKFLAFTELGDFSLQRYKLSFNGPLVNDSVYFGLGGSFTRRDGYTKNKILGSEVDDRESMFGRGAFYLYGWHGF